MTAALAEYVRRRKQSRILDAFGMFDFDPSYDYKYERHNERSLRGTVGGKVRPSKNL